MNSFGACHGQNLAREHYQCSRVSHLTPCEQLVEMVQYVKPRAIMPYVGLEVEEYEFDFCSLLSSSKLGLLHHFDCRFVCDQNILGSFGAHSMTQVNQNQTFRLCMRQGLTRQ
jgi:hypothetical protein